MMHKTKNERETLKVARDFAKNLHGGELVLLSGILGVGKTVFVKGLAKAIGVKGIVKSPTFNLMKCYKGDFKLCHIDAYRLDSLDDLLDIGIEDYISDDTIIIVEWAERVKGIEKMGKNIKKINIVYGRKKDERKIEIK